MKHLENELAETRSQLQWIDDIIMGKEVSDFATSFRIVNEVAELKQELQEWQDGEYNLRVDLLKAIRLLRRMSRKWGRKPSASMDGLNADEIDAFLTRFSHWPE